MPKISIWQNSLFEVPIKILCGQIVSILGRGGEIAKAKKTNIQKVLLLN
jgi:hypothetical protein